ncbi:MAG: glycosyltransferase [Halioglobus sp.]|nr:glycosyltransferase [Halioglobus sp.]
MREEKYVLPPQRFAFLLDNLRGGGAERVVLNIASEFVALGHTVDLLVCEFRGELCNSIPEGVNLIQLEASGRLFGLWSAVSATSGGIPGIISCLKSAHKVPASFRYIRALETYLSESGSSVLFSVLPKANISAILAAARAKASTKIFIGVQNSLSAREARGLSDGKGQMHHMVSLMRFCYGRAEGIVAASCGVAEDAIRFLDLDPDKVHVVYNPVSVPDSPAEESLATTHPWLDSSDIPVILGIGRMVKQKNFPLLIRAFAAVRGKVDCRLLILGGDDSSADQMAVRQSLQGLASELGFSADVGLLGYQPNPQDYLRSACVFVLSSRYEGFGNVLVEALLAGCPVVSTDCPSGPSEILEGGIYGQLVPLENIEALAGAIIAALENAPEPEVLRRRGREFSPERAAAKYQQLFLAKGTDLSACRYTDQVASLPAAQERISTAGSSAK